MARKTQAQKDADNLAAVLDKIPQMFGADADAGLRMHEIIMAAAPELKARLWYGMPGYAKAAAKPVLVFIRKDDYLTFGLTPKRTCCWTRTRPTSSVPTPGF